MKPLLSLLFLIFFSTSLLGAEPLPPQTSDITVVSWNLRWFPGGHPRASRSQAYRHTLRAQKALESLHPNLFLCQEIRSKKDMDKLIRVIPGMTTAIVSDFTPSKKKLPPQNLAIASTFPVRAASSHSWKNGLPRGFVFAAIELPNTLLLTYSVHLKSNRGNTSDEQKENKRIRHESSRQLLAHIQKRKAFYASTTSHKIAILIGGDFNTSLDETRFQKERTLRRFLQAGFHWAFSQVPLAQRYTLPGRPRGSFPPTCFDHFLTQGLGSPKAQVISTFSSISDHRPILLTFPENP